MSRDELKALGMTDEQIEKVMASHAKDIQSANTKAEQYKADAQKAVDLQKQLDEINSKNMTDIEKANKANEDANNKIVELQKEIARMNHISELAKMGIIGEQAEKLVGDNGIDYAVLGQIISDRESKAAVAKEQEIANKGGNPGSGANPAGNPEKTGAEKVAEQVGKMIGGVSKSSADILSHYTN